jgi:hypothetical protein
MTDGKNMAPEVKDGGQKLKWCNIVFCSLFFAMSFYLTSEKGTGVKFCHTCQIWLIDPRWRIKIGFFYYNFKSLQCFFNLLCANNMHILWIFFLEKSKMADFREFQTPFRIFLKVFVSRKLKFWVLAYFILKHLILRISIKNFFRKVAIQMLFSIETLINTVGCIHSEIEFVLNRSYRMIVSMKIYICMATFRKKFFLSKF